MLPFACFLLLSPALMIELSIDRTVIPKGADNWNRIGLFKLRDGGNDRLILLYYYDSDSVAEKIMAKKGSATFSYPNFFDVHAIYQAAPGKWAHKEVFGFARVRFNKVAKVAPDHLVRECRPNFMIRLEDLDNQLKRGEEINKPFTMRVLFIDGVLTAK